MLKRLWLTVNSRQLQQARYPCALGFQVERGDKARGDGGFVRRALVLLQAADLRLAVADRDGQFALGETGAAAQELEQLAEGGELLRGKGLGAGHRFDFSTVVNLRDCSSAKVSDSWACDNWPPSLPQRREGVTPAQAGVQSRHSWMPASAGMTVLGQSSLPPPSACTCRLPNFRLGSRWQEKAY